MTGRHVLRVIGLSVRGWDADSETLTAFYSNQPRQFSQAGSTGRGREVLYRHQLSSGTWLCFFWGLSHSKDLATGGVPVEVFILTPKDRQVLGIDRPGADLVGTLLEHGYR